MRNIFKYLFTIIASLFGISRDKEKEFKSDGSNYIKDDYKPLVTFKPQKTILSPKEYGILLNKGGKFANKYRHLKA